MVCIQVWHLQSLNVQGGDCPPVKHCVRELPVWQQTDDTANRTRQLDKWKRIKREEPDTGVLHICQSSHNKEHKAFWKLPLWMDFKTEASASAALKTDSLSVYYVPTWICLSLFSETDLGQKPHRSLPRADSPNQDVRSVSALPPSSLPLLLAPSLKAERRNCV